MYSTPPANIDTLHEALFSGAILRFSGLAEMQALTAHAEAFARDHLAPHDPTLIHAHLDRAALADTLNGVQRAFSNDPQAKALWSALFAALGFDPDDTVRDRLIMRFQPPIPAEGGPHRARSTATVGFHRDSWGTNLYAQVNWWAPVFPIDAGRTFAFLPALFDTPLPNDSQEFDLAAIMAHNRTAPVTADRKQMAPRPLEPIDPALGQPVLLDPGEIIAFSAQHAHVGVPNRTDRTRISIETRTLRLADQRAGRGAPNVDGSARWVAYGMFRRLSDGVPLTQALGVQALESFAGGPA
jgi:hypothetical protein